MHLGRVVEPVVARYRPLPVDADVAAAVVVEEGRRRDRCWCWRYATLGVVTMGELSNTEEEGGVMRTKGRVDIVDGRAFVNDDEGQRMCCGVLLSSLSAVGDVRCRWEWCYKRRSV